MPSKKYYLDFAATSFVRKEVLDEMLPYFTEKFGNPSSIHLWGQETKGAIETAREEVAQLLGAHSEEIIFTSGGTEANNLALFGLLENGKERNHFIVSKIEHPSILSACRNLEKKGFRITYLPVDSKAKVSLEALAKAITPETLLVSIMHANNEVGTIQPLKEIGEIIRLKSKEIGKKIYFHSDGVQSAGSLPIDVQALGLDLMSISSHKLYGPKGMGALFVRKKTPLSPLLYGGSQERKLRPSTENVPGIVGFGKAAFLAKNEQASFAKEMQELREFFKKELIQKVEGLILNGHPTDRLPNNLNFSVPFIEGESLILLLSQQGVAASTGSACSSHSLEPSHVLLSMGISHELAHGSIRFSLGKTTTLQDLKEVTAIFSSIVEKLRKMSPLGR